MTFTVGLLSADGLELVYEGYKRQEIEMERTGTGLDRHLTNTSRADFALCHGDLHFYGAVVFADGKEVWRGNLFVPLHCDRHCGVTPSFLEGDLNLYPG